MASSSRVCRELFMTHHRRLVIAWIAAASVFSACMFDEPTDPSLNPDFDFLIGKWVGPLTDDTEGEGVLTLSISGGQVSILGNWAMARNGQTRTGGLSVIPANSPIATTPDNRIVANCAELGGLAFWLGTNVSFSQNHMSGDYVSSQCGGFTTGKFTVTRQ